MKESKTNKECKYKGLVGKAFLHARASLLWSRAWNPTLHTYVEGGLRYVFNPDLDITGSYELSSGRVNASRNMNLDRWSEFINVGLSILPSEPVIIDISYTRSFSDNTKGHSAYLRFNYLF